MGEAVGCFAALKHSADAALAAGTVVPGEGVRTRDQVMADELVTRITGIDPARQGFPVEVHVVMDDDSLFDGGPASAVGWATPGRSPSRRRPARRPVDR
ncbi:MAG: hypothetical protein ACR2FV_17465 [Ornithinimicrobium sp.]|uniref:hypothetical protein n=1 Tax=Ornithinimicrobium sp. TaxID=1977084 RepID=UPI003D9BEDD0